MIPTVQEPNSQQLELAFMAVFEEKFKVLPQFVWDKKHFMN